MSRKIARESIFKLIFASKNDNELIDKDFLMETVCKDVDLDDADIKYIHNTYNGVFEKRAELENIIIKYIPNYKKERIYNVDMSLLMLATYELYYCKDIPQKVIVSEAVNLVKKYSTEKSVGFVNGVLSNILRDCNE